MADENVFAAFGAMFQEPDDEFQDPRDPGSYGGSLSANLPLPPNKRSEFGLCGLQNQGATCYLNSLLQAMYMTPELRRGLYAIDPEELGLSVQEAQEASPAAETDESSAGLPSEAAKPKGKKAVRTLPLELQRLFAELQASDRAAVSTERLTTLGFGWSANEERVQHDVSELNRMLYTNVESSLKGTSGRKLIQELYEGMGVTQTRCDVCGNARGREEVLYSVDVSVKGFPNMIQSLIAATEFERMDGPNAIECPTCGCKTNSRLGRKLRKLPPVLVVNQQRIVFDMERLDRVKVSDRFEFPLVLDMAPFLENGELDVLRGTATASVTSDDSVTPAVCKDVWRRNIWLSDLKTEESREVAAAVSASMNSRPDLHNVYDLFAVVLHSGSPHGGHYHAYIRDVLGEGNWRVLSGSDAFDTLASHSTAASPAPASSIPTVLEAGSPLPVILQIMSDAPMHPTWKLKFLQLDTLGTQISTVAKASWKAAYRAQYGGMKEFIEKQPVWFEIRGQAVVLKKEPQPSDFTVSEVVASARVSDGTRDDIASVVLAQKLHAEESGSIPGKDDPWSVAGGKRKTRNAPASGPAPSNSNPHEIMAAEWGHWFDFNDSAVTPMTVSSLEKAFSGSECGYMLMYRSRGLNASGDGSEGGINLPERWEAKLTEANVQLNRQRDEYELRSHQLEVTFKSPSAFVVSPAGQLQLDAEADVFTVTMIVDDRWLFSELKQRVFEALAPVDPQLTEVGVDALRFHTVNQLGDTGNAYHLYNELGGDTDAMKAPVIDLKPVIGHGRVFLVWNGATIAGRPVGIGEQAEPLTVHVTFLDSATAKTHVDVTLPKCSTLVALKSAIGTACGGVSASVVDVFTVSGTSSRKLAVKVADKRVNGAPAKLNDLGIKHGTEVIAERSVDDRGKTRSRPLAFDEVLKRDKLVELYVEDHTKSGSLVPASERMAFQLEKDAPLSTLRALVLSKLGVSQDSIEGGGRFRKSDGLLIGALIEDEGDTVLQAGLRDGSVLWFEPGKALTKHELELKYEVYTGNKTTPTGGGGKRVKTGELIIHASATIDALKATILAAAGMSEKDPKLVRLRRTNAFGEGLGRPLESEQVTLAKEGIPNGALIWLEDGVVVKKGMALIHFNAWVPECCDSIAASIPNGVFPQVEARGGVLHSVKSAVSTVLSSLLPSIDTGERSGAPPSDSSSAEPKLDALDYVLRLRKACLLPLPQLTLPEDTTLLALKVQLLSSNALWRAREFATSHPAADAAKPSTEHETVGPSLAEAGLTPKHLRIREKASNNVPGRVLKGDAKTLKNLFVVTGKELIVEVLSEAETLYDESLVLWVQRHHPNPDVVGSASSTKAGSGSASPFVALCGSNTPIWPPESVVLRCPAKPTYSDFVTALAPAVGIPLEKLRVAKLFLGKKVPIEWKTMTPSFSESGTGKSHTGKRKGAKGKGHQRQAVPSIINAPWSIKDGDLIAVLNTDEDPDGKDDWMRVEDYCVIAREQQYREMVKLSRASARSGGGGGYRSRGPEIALRMAGDYEFGSDSEGNDDADDNDDNKNTGGDEVEPEVEPAPVDVEVQESEARGRSDSEVARELDRMLNQ